MGIFDFLSVPDEPRAKPADKPRYEEEDCPLCGGSGWYQDFTVWDGSGREMCTTCAGSGRVQK